MLESALQYNILKRLKEIGFWTVKTIACNKDGVPDILACKDGRFYAFEVKTCEGVVSCRQEREILKIGRAGGIACVVRSVEELNKILLSEH